MNMNNVSRKAQKRQAIGITGNWRNQIDPWEHLGYTLVNRASVDYSRICKQIADGLYANSHELKTLMNRRETLRREFCDQQSIVARLIDILPAFDDMIAEDVIERLEKIAS